MTIQFVLIRHGIAENCSEDRRDFSRRLTEKGRQRLAATLPSLLPLLRPMLEEQQERQIWTSPLIRAIETAEIAADIFNIDKVISCDFIAEGYFNGFWNAVEELDQSADRTIFVVGHEPFMGYWSQALCGAFLPFKKGAAACFVYQKGDPGTAELQWFFQPEGMEMLSDKSDSSHKSDSSQSLGKIRETLVLHAHQVLTEREKFLSDPSEPETAHQLRVSIRRLRSLLTFIKPFQKTKQNASMQAVLKSVVTELSYLRELDVLRQACETFAEENPDKASDQTSDQTSDKTSDQTSDKTSDKASGKASDQTPDQTTDESSIFGILKEERRRETDRVVAVISTDGSKSALQDIEDELAEIEWKKNIDENESIEAQISRSFTALFEEFEAAAASVDYGEAAAVHALRIQAKKLRYVLSSIEPLMESKLAITGIELKKAQETLGQLCDARRNKQILQNFDTRDLPVKSHYALLSVIDYQDRIISERLRFLKT